MKDVYLVGYTSIALGADPALGGTDAFIMQFDGDTGATLWTKQFGTAGNDRAFGIAFFDNRLETITMSWERPSVRWMERQIWEGMTPSSSGTTSSEKDCNEEELPDGRVRVNKTGRNRQQYKLIGGKQKMAFPLFVLFVRSMQALLHNSPHSPRPPLHGIVPG